MNETFECKNQNPMAEEIFRMFNHPPDQKVGEEMTDEERALLEVRKSKEKYDFQKLERIIQDTMQQNADLRERIAQYQEKISELEQEIRNRDSEDGDDMIRLIRKLSGTYAAEIQVTVRMKNFRNQVML